MTVFNKIIFVLFLVSLVACGKTDDQKASDSAYQQAAEYNSLATDIGTNGPDMSMSKRELDAYEGKLNRLESLNSSLQAVNGTHGITVSGGDATVLIFYRRAALSIIRTRKTRAAAAEASSSDGN